MQSIKDRVAQSASVRLLHGRRGLGFRSSFGKRSDMNAARETVPLIRQLFDDFRMLIRQVDGLTPIIG